VVRVELVRGCRVQREISTEFWLFYMSAILCGLLNDGLFQERFEVRGFEATLEGRFAVFQHAQKVAAAGLRAELRKRFVKSGCSGEDPP
jgi:hypothetical protein